MATKYNLISADSHVFEPGDLWQKYTEKKYLSQAPRLVKQGGDDVIVADWGLGSSPGMGASAGKKAEDVKLRGNYSDIRPGTYDPVARLKDMAMDGVDAEVIYPTVGMSLYRAPDAAVMMALFRAYNDWLVDFVKVGPEKYVGIGVINTDPVDEAVKEVERSAKRGLRGVMIPAAPNPDKPFSTKHYDPIWQAASDAGLPVSLHTFAAPVSAVSVNDWCVTYSVATMQIQTSISAMIFSGVFERFPKLRLVSVENDVSWAPNLMERMDHAYNRHRFWAGTQLMSGKLPSAFFKDHVYMTFVRDIGAAPMRNIIGLGNIMWSSDYPHSDTSWPNSRKLIAEQFASVPPAELHHILAGNVAKLYHMN